MCEINLPPAVKAAFDDWEANRFTPSITQQEVGVLECTFHINPIGTDNGLYP